MKQVEEPKAWKAALKLLVIAVALIGGVGAALWYAAQQPVHSPALEQAQREAQTTGQNTGTKPPTGNPWGIAGDSPIRPKR